MWAKAKAVVKVSEVLSPPPTASKWTWEQRRRESRFASQSAFIKEEKAEERSVWVAQWQLVVRRLINATPTASKAKATSTSRSTSCFPLTCNFLRSPGDVRVVGMSSHGPNKSRFFNSVLLGRLLPLYCWLEATEKAKCWLPSEAGSWECCAAGSTPLRATLFPCPQDTSSDVK